MQQPKIAAAVLAALLTAGSASAVSVPFLEDYPSNVAAWEDNIQNPLLHSVAGGPDGGAYATTTFNYSTFTVPPFGGGPVIFRANDSDNASGDAFVLLQMQRTAS